MKNKLQKLILVALTFAGLGIQIGCGRAETKAYAATIKSNHFTQEITAEAVVSQYYYEGGLEPNLELLTFAAGSVQINGYWHTQDEVKKFAQLLTNYDSSLNYKFDADCGSLTQRNNYENLADKIDCNVRFYSYPSNDPENQTLILNYEFKMKSED